MEKISVIIPVYGQWALVKRNVDALLRFDGGLVEEILIVDDCSAETNPYTFDSALVKLVSNERNLGYAGTVNHGLRKAVSRIVVLLDSDAFAIGPFVQKLIALYKSDDAIGCIGFSTVDEQGNDTGNFQFESSIRRLIVGQALDFRTRFVSFKRKRNILPNSCAVSFRQDCLKDVGYFDEINFPVLEADTDLSMRIHRSNWKLLFTRQITICHKGGNSYQVNYKRVLLYHKSKWTLLKKFNLIMFPGLSKTLLKIRVRLELCVLDLCSRFQKEDGDLREKKYGRQILLKEIDGYC